MGEEGCRAARADSGARGTAEVGGGEHRGDPEAAGGMRRIRAEPTTRRAVGMGIHKKVGGEGEERQSTRW